MTITDYDVKRILDIAFAYARAYAHLMGVNPAILHEEHDAVAAFLNNLAAERDALRATVVRQEAALARLGFPPPEPDHAE